MLEVALFWAVVMNQKMSAESNSRTQDDDSSSLCVPWLGSEPFLVGIAPNFWAHVPTSIAAIDALKLINGMHCWSSGRFHIPVSKCILFGCIVNACIRSSDESLLYVLDDGTGLIDCLAWTNNSANDIFHLPSLLAEGSNKATKDVGIGDIVRIFGKIQCVTIHGENNSGNEPFVIREIQASLVERIDRISNEEARHWKACADHEKAMARDPTKFNALSYLKQLGPDITNQVEGRRNLPSNDDKLGEWRIHGTSCTCVLDYKVELLYCHCLAKVESLDPELVFRDALLNHLLQVQTKHAKKLIFPYKGIKINQKLREIASVVISNQDKANQEARIKLLVDRLLLNTFRALRHDGIVHLADESTDKYLLISRKWVLEPLIRLQLTQKNAEISKNFIDLEGAPYLSPVHRDRLLYIKRCIIDERKKRDGATKGLDETV